MPLVLLMAAMFIRSRAVAVAGIASLGVLLLVGYINVFRLHIQRWRRLMRRDEQPLD
jgi:hypothetical protein